jgi:hypothetical protein
MGPGSSGDYTAFRSAAAVRGPSGSLTLQQTARARVPKRSAGAEQPVVVMQCRVRHCITHADWRTMPNGLVFPEIHGELFVIGSA